ncbi:MAG: nucleotidyltransferase domain-containing protein [Candidatus Omnitrophota bacterium]
MKPLTKNQAELLRLFFTNPDKAFYMQQIGRILGKKPGVFQRTLNNLASENILKSEYKANARYFKINKSYPLYEELKSIIFKTVGVVGSIGTILEKIENIKIAFIYGSYAKKRQNSLSDIDILIIGKPNEDKLSSCLDNLEEKLQREINYKLYSLVNFREDIKNKEPFISEILEDKKIMIKGNEDELRKIIKR